MIVIAVDASKVGAFCSLLDDGSVTLLESFPVVGDERPRVDTPALTYLLRLALTRDAPNVRGVRAILDRDNHYYGGVVVDGARRVFEHCGIPLVRAPRGWRAEFGLNSGDESIAKARLAAPNLRFDGPHALAKARTLLLARLTWRSLRKQRQSQNLPDMAVTA